MVGLRNREFRLALLHLGELKLIIKLHQQLIFAHPVPIPEIKLGNSPTYLRANHHSLTRAQAAHGLGVVG